MHSAGTTVGKCLSGLQVVLGDERRLIALFESIEGSWEDVMRLIGQAHTMLHRKGVVRIQTDIRVGSRYVLTIRLRR